jgi:hypothetical protein
MRSRQRHIDAGAVRACVGFVLLVVQEGIGIPGRRICVKCRRNKLGDSSKMVGGTATAGAGEYGGKTKPQCWI